MKEYMYLIVPFSSLILAQLIKFTIESIQYKKFNWRRLINGNGGMPSTHTSFCISLTVFIGLNEGITTPLFALGVIFSFIVSYDAMGLRRESEKQAVAINKIVDELDDDNPRLTMKKLKEQIGHEPMEVIMGVVLGTIMAFIWNLLI
ncbi:MAG: divergent PAP2 family protein [Bacilli bacterium]|nr:divergent PAP2 family protein [Bacilli bacterium]MDD4607790.1 divergent PAP2 family protein [Bacilli bacterium]